MALTTRIEIDVAATETGTADLGTPTMQHALASVLSLASGTAINQADVIWSDERTVGDGATDSLDLAGVLTGALGSTITMAKLKGVIVVADSANTTTLSVAQPASNPVPLFGATADVDLPAGGAFVYFNPSLAGIAVTAGTGDQLDIVNSAGATADYKIILIGTSA